MKSTIHNEAAALLQQSERIQPGLITEAQVLGLPEPMQRYLRYAQVIGKEPIRTVCLTQHGFMRTQPGQKWLPMVAEQSFMTTTPAFLWHATVRPFPFAWLSDAIEWQAIDTHSVKATIREAGVTASMVLHVNEQGQVTSLSTDRYREEHGHYLLTPWSGQCNTYQEVDGMRIPSEIDITWNLASGDFTWFRCKITEIEYNQSGKVMRL